MKKLLSLTLVFALCACVLSGCKKSVPSAEEAPEAQFAPEPVSTEVPDEGYHGEEDQSAALADMPTLEPPVPLEGADDGGESDYFSIDAMLNDGAEDGGDAPAATEMPAPAVNPNAVKAIDPSVYQYSALTDTTLGFTFNYPSHWENVPGVYTVCFRERVEPDDFPARVAITAKTLVHSPDETVITEELTEYLRMVHKQYEAATFQAGVPSTEERFLGKPALSNTYLAYAGEHEVKGYIIGTAVGRTMYVFHFCATYEDYGAMESIMRYMVKSAEIVENQ